MTGRPLTEQDVRTISSHWTGQIHQMAEDWLRLSRLVETQQHRLGEAQEALKEIAEDEMAARDAMEIARAALASHEPAVTHGRHCRCSACAREDWTNPNLACCGMHGPSCPNVYAPHEPADTEEPQ